MIANYDKVIVLRDDENKEVKGIVIFDEKSHTPVHYIIDKLGMDGIIELYKDNSKLKINNVLTPIKNNE